MTLDDFFRTTVFAETGEWVSQPIHDDALVWRAHVKIKKNEFPPSISKVFFIELGCSMNDGSSTSFEMVHIGNSLEGGARMMNERARECMKSKKISRGLLLNYGYEESGAFKFRRPVMDTYVVEYAISQANCVVSVNYLNRPAGPINAASFVVGKYFHRDILIYESKELAKKIGVGQSEFFADMPEVLRMAVVELDV